MPYQNRVDPFSRFHAVPTRGAWMGNRGRLHSNETGQLTKQTWSQNMWVLCVMDFKGRKKAPMPPGKYTSLFFLDEVTGLAAGHRPCFECRRTDAVSFREVLGRGLGLDTPPTAKAMDKRMNAEMKPHLKKYGALPREAVDPAILPDGALFAVGQAAYLIWQGKARRWSWDGYGQPESLPNTAHRLTPETSCAALRGGYRPQINGLQNTS